MKDSGSFTRASNPPDTDQIRICVIDWGGQQERGSDKILQGKCTQPELLRGSITLFITIYFVIDDQN